ncbi:hypothetical protein CSQ96_19405 [Janthinobacterium sp. BJB412]|nr:hypothetical protein CSQ96_19405 [Janthinobacterium sp. BJB412]
MDTIIQPITTRAKRGPYRQHSDEFKRAAVARTLVAGASVSLIARELKINTNQLFSWRKRFGAETPVDGNALGRLNQEQCQHKMPSHAAWHFAFLSCLLLCLELFSASQHPSFLSNREDSAICAVTSLLLWQPRCCLPDARLFNQSARHRCDR